MNTSADPASRLTPFKKKHGGSLGTKVFLLCFVLVAFALFLNTLISVKKNRNDKRRHLYYALLIESVSYGDRISDLIKEAKEKLPHECPSGTNAEALSQSSTGELQIGGGECRLSIDPRRLQGQLSNESLSSVYLYSAKSKTLFPLFENSKQKSLAMGPSLATHPLVTAVETSPFKRSTLDFDAQGNTFVGSFIKIPAQNGISILIESPRESLSSELKTLVLQQMLIAILLGALCLIAALLFSKKITAPLKALMEFADNMAAGRYGEKSDIKTNDELEELSDHFTRLSERLLDREKKLEAASELASRDGMTGLYNFRFFKQKIEELLPLSKRNRWTFALLLLDVDHFKAVNDTYGHPQGDYVLKQLAELLLKHNRQTDYVCRYGGEEFAILASSETTIDKVLIFGEKIRDAFEKLEIKILDKPNKTMKCTVSIGVATFAPTDDLKAPMPKADELIKISDAKLYQAKKAGRNRVVG